MHRHSRALKIAGLLVTLGSAMGGPGRAVASEGWTDDALLQGLVRDAVGHSPGLQKALLQVRADGERAGIVSALPDPTLTVGWQNDGLLPGASQMGLTYPLIMASQAFPGPGKRQLREQVNQAGVQTAAARLERLRLGLRAQVERAFLTLLLLRSEQKLVAAQQVLLKQAEAVARERLAVGPGTQVEVLRAQLEFARLGQRRASLQSQERTQVLEINRLAARPPSAPLATALVLEDLGLPSAPTDAVQAAEQASPELAAARLSVQQADKQTELAKAERRPDFVASAGVMPKLDGQPMWQIGVSVSLPLWSKSKQDKAISGSELDAQAGRQTQEEVRELLALRTRERLEQLQLNSELVAIYQRELLSRSEATVRAALSQFGAGRATFSGVLDALSGLYADRSAWLGALAQAQAQVVALREASLDPAPGVSTGSAPMPSSTASSQSNSRASGPSGPTAGGGMTGM